MSRRRDCRRGLMVDERNTKCTCPFLGKFLERIEPGCDVMLTRGLHLEYTNMVMRLTTDKTLHKISKSFSRFHRQFSREALRHGWKYSRKRRGYFLRVVRDRRVQLPAPDRSSLSVHHIDAIKGFGLFADVDMPAGFQLCEFLGQKIDKAEKERRQVVYEREGRPYSFLDLPGGRFLDGYRDVDGREFERHQNVASVINHSGQPNCKLQQHNGHIYVVTLTNVSRGTELLLNYGDTSRNRPHFLRV